MNIAEFAPRATKKEKRVSTAERSVGSGRVRYGRKEVRLAKSNMFTV